MNSLYADSKICMVRLNRGSPDRSTETVDWNHCTYQFPTLFNATDSVNGGHEFLWQNHWISAPRWRWCRDKIGSFYSIFPEHSKPIKKYVEILLRWIYNLTTGIIIIDNKIIFNISDPQLKTSKVREITDALDNASDPNIREVERLWTFFSLY